MILEHFLYFIGFLLSLSGFIVAIVAAINDKNLYNKTVSGSISDIDAIEQSLNIRDLNSSSIIITCIGFLLIHVGHIWSILKFKKTRSPLRY